MDIEQVKCVSLELAKELKEAGYKQEGLWWYVSVRKGEPELYQESPLGLIEATTSYAYKRIAVAPTVTELGEALSVNSKIRGILNYSKDGNLWRCLFGKQMPEHTYATFELTEADARAKRLLYLKKENLL